MEATINTNIILEMFKSFDFSVQEYLMKEFSSIIKTEKRNRPFAEVEADLWNGKSVAKEEAKEFLRHYADPNPQKKYTKEELLDDILISEKEIANGEVTDDEDVEKCFDALFKSL